MSTSSSATSYSAESVSQGRRRAVFQAEFGPHVQFRQIIESMKDLVVSVVFYCTSSGIYIIASNVTNVSLVYVFLQASCCRRYTCPEQQPVVFAVSLFEAVTCMKPSKKKLNNRIIITMYPQGRPALDGVMQPDPNLYFDFINDASGQPTLKRGNVPLLPSVPVLDVPNLPNLASASICSMPSHELKRIWIELTIVATVVTLTLDADTIKFRAVSADGKGEIVAQATPPGMASPEDELVIKIRPEHVAQLPLAQNFVLRFLNFFSKPAQLTKRVTLGLTPHKPLFVHYELDKIGTITYYLGQRDAVTSTGAASGSNTAAAAAGPVTRGVYGVFEDPPGRKPKLHTGR